MSASTIAANRLLHGTEREKRSSLPLSMAQTARIRAALLAADSGRCALPDSATFDVLREVGVEEPLSIAAAQVFSSHHTYRLPREDSHAFDLVHRFHLTGGRASSMNAALKRFALNKERKARASGRMPQQLKASESVMSLPPPGKRSDAGVSISNEGGFQSYPDLFDYGDLLKYASPAGHRSLEGHRREGARLPSCESAPFTLNEWGRSEFGEEDVKGRQHCHELHRIASLAIKECTDPAEEAPESGFAVHRANGWLNVNRADDINFMHVHIPDRFSGTYYVASSPQSDQSLDGRMIFRSGPKRAADGSVPPSSHTYMTVPPVPGSLWLFPGTVPHRVLGMAGAADAGADGSRGQWGPRISIAMNFLDAQVPVDRSVHP